MSSDAVPSSPPGDPATRRAILEAARALLEAGGAVRLADVGRAAGVSRQAVYLHFGSRTGLLVALVQYVDESQRLDERAEVVRRAPSALAAIDRFAELWAEYLPSIAAVARALLAARDHDAAAAAAWDDRMRGLREVARFLIRRLADEGRLARGWTVEGATDACWAMILPQVWHALSVEQGWSRRRYARGLGLMLRGAFVSPERS